MQKKLVIYSKRNGEPPVPLTTHIAWLPDGTIQPLMYWTPDGTCYQVIARSPGVSLAFLKDGGEGLRFDVRAEMLETPEPYDVQGYTRHETYLYLADKRFSEKNIIDGRYAHAGKAYIPVTLDIFPDGDYELIDFWVRGARYLVERTVAIENRGSFLAGGIGVRHKVEARLVNVGDDGDPDPHQCVRRLASVYCELNKWFVSVESTV